MWAEVGVKLGRNRMQEYMDRFGFGEKPPMDYPDRQMFASGPRDPQEGEIIPMSSDRVDVGRTAIGQALLLVTPLQMATVAQTIGNGGDAHGAAAGGEGSSTRRGAPSTSRCPSRPSA